MASSSARDTMPAEGSTPTPRITKTRAGEPINTLIKKDGEEYISRVYMVIGNQTKAQTRPFITLEIIDGHGKHLDQSHGDRNSVMGVRKDNEKGGTSGWDQISKEKIGTRTHVTVEYWRESDWFEKGSNGKWEHRWYVY